MKKYFGRFSGKQKELYMELINLLLDKVDEIRWNLTYKLEDFVDKIKNRCTKNPETCKKINCSCPFVGEFLEEIDVKPKKKKKNNVKKTKKNN